MPKKIDMEGTQWGRLTCLTCERVAQGGRRYRCLFKCECGGEIITDPMTVRRGDCQSCGCIRREKSPKNWGKFANAGEAHPNYKPKQRKPRGKTYKKRHLNRKPKPPKPPKPERKQREKPNRTCGSIRPICAVGSLRSPRISPDGEGIVERIEKRAEEENKAAQEIARAMIARSKELMKKRTQTFRRPL